MYSGQGDCGLSFPLVLLYVFSLASRILCYISSLFFELLFYTAPAFESCPFHLFFFLLTFAFSLYSLFTPSRYVFLTSQTLLCVSRATVHDLVRQCVAGGDVGC